MPLVWVALLFIHFEDAFLKIYNSEGVKGLYRGVLPLLLNSLPASAIWWTIYEESKGRISASIDLFNANKRHNNGQHEAVVVKQHAAAQVGSRKT